MAAFCETVEHYGRPATCFVPRWVVFGSKPDAKSPWVYKCDECREAMEAIGWHFEPLQEEDHDDHA